MAVPFLFSMIIQDHGHIAPKKQNDKGQNSTEDLACYHRAIEADHDPGVCDHADQDRQKQKAQRFWYPLISKQTCQKVIHKIAPFIFCLYFNCCFRELQEREAVILVI